MDQIPVLEELQPPCSLEPASLVCLGSVPHDVHIFLELFSYAVPRAELLFNNEIWIRVLPILSNT
jgi:hypothetical protein